mmetsp:Transcript_59593/g.141799  ORF Transcript_59593/g.141799 Transcript_59593/m.141799 type:complete len:304 (+) Transcript_59593:122-1033(+)
MSPDAWRRCRLILALCVAILHCQTFFKDRLFAGQVRQRFERASIRCPRTQRQASERNPFEILTLEVRPGITKAQIKSAFRRRAAEVHPDVPGTGDVEEFRRVTWAYEELMDPSQQQKWFRQAAPRRQRRRRRSSSGGMAEPDEFDLQTLDEDWDEYINARERAARERWVAREMQNLEQEMQQLRQTESEGPGRLLLRRLFMKGNYAQAGKNHDRPLFKKVEEDSGQGQPPPEVYIFYWDNRDGDELSGWWIGPSVGGVITYAFNGDSAADMPPTSGWRMPAVGPVDERLRVQIQSGAGVRLEF